MKIIGDTVQFDTWEAMTIREDLPATVRDRLVEVLEGLYDGDGQWMTDDDLRRAVEEELANDGGYDKGYDDGYDNGYDNGYDDGYDDGYAVAQAEAGE